MLAFRMNLPEGSLGGSLLPKLVIEQLPKTTGE